MRTFVALEAPESFVDDTAAMARQLEAVVDGRFMARGTYHLTLAFLGEVGEAQAADAIGALDRACEGAAPVMLTPVKLGHFGRARDATLWLGLEETPELMGLAEAVRTELSAAGLSFDAKSFRPHITLARRAVLPRGALPELGFPAPAEASRVTLFKSTLSQSGATYKPLYTVELGGEDGEGALP